LHFFPDGQTISSNINFKGYIKRVMRRLPHLSASIFSQLQQHRDFHSRRVRGPPQPAEGAAMYWAPPEGVEAVPHGRVQRTRAVGNDRATAEEMMARPSSGYFSANPDSSGMRIVSETVRDASPNFDSNATLMSPITPAEPDLSEMPPPQWDTVPPPPGAQGTADRPRSPLAQQMPPAAADNRVSRTRGTNIPTTPPPPPPASANVASTSGAPVPPGATSARASPQRSANPNLQEHYEQPGYQQQHSNRQGGAAANQEYVQTDKGVLFEVGDNRADDVMKQALRHIRWTNGVLFLMALVPLGVCTMTLPGMLRALFGRANDIYTLGNGGLGPIEGTEAQRAFAVKDPKGAKVKEWRRLEVEAETERARDPQGAQPQQQPTQQSGGWTGMWSGARNDPMASLHSGPRR
jgi:hypothetical protein